MEIICHSKRSESGLKPAVSLILLDWSCRESFHSLDYLAKQTVRRDAYEIVWIEYYKRKPSEIEDRLNKNNKLPVIDQWIILGMPENTYYHKHLMYNIGIVKSHGDIVVICDSDAIFSSMFVETVINAFQNNPYMALHLDQVRNVNKKFYPFSYPSIKNLLGKGCVNFKDGKTTGLWDQVDSIHSRNYGACMAAKREYLIAIGGADEHIDFLGHVCGPYDMTFRLRNFGVSEIWHDKEFLYHTWHPGQSGDGNYVGPHDGRLISTTALETLKSGRVYPLVENKAIEMLRTGSGYTVKELEEQLIDQSYISLFTSEGVLKKGKMQLWYDHELIGFYNDYNIIRYRGALYGVPAFLQLGGLDKELQEKNHPTLIKAETIRAVMKAIDRFDPLSLKTRRLAQHDEYNIIQYGRRIYGVPQILSDMDFHDPKVRLEIEDLSADTVEAVTEIIDKTERSLYFPVMLEKYQEYNLIKWRNRIYGLPEILCGLDFYNPQQRCKIENLSADTIEEVKGLINKTDRSIYWPVVLEKYQEYNLIKWRNRIYGLPVTLHDMDFYNPQQLHEVEKLSADTVEKVKGLIDSIDSSLFVPTIIKVYKEFNLVRYQDKVYGVPHSFGEVDFSSLQQRRQFDYISGDRVDEVKDLIDKEGRSLYSPVVLDTCKEYNIVKYQGRLYGLPRALGKVDFMQGSQKLHAGIISAKTQQELISLVERKVSGESNIGLLEYFDHYNIVSFDSRIYGVPESFGPVNSIREYWLDLPGVILGKNCEQVKKLIHSTNSWATIPFLLSEYKNYNIVRCDNCYYAAPHSIGNVDLGDEHARSHPGIISANHLNQLKVQIDKIEKTVPIEYAGWLPSFRKFGNCGCHPQFRHIRKPPKGYRFTFSAPPGNDQPEKKSLRQKVSLLVKYMQLFFAAARLAFSAHSNGANWHYILHFFKTRNLRSQLLVPRKTKLLFLPSVPYTVGQYPWVIEIEDSISLLFPFVHNGNTDAGCFRKLPYYPIFKALFESKSCRGIITHIKSTADNLPKLFQSYKLASKIKHIPLGVELPKVYHEAERKDDKIRILFNNSWHQDPRSFFIRGGLDVLSAFDKLHRNYPNVHLTLRTSLPSMHPRFKTIIEQNQIEVIDYFLPDREWEALITNSDIYLLPSDRIHVVSMLEAMSYGLAVVVSDGWGVQEYIEHGRNGMVVKGRYGKVTWMDDETGMLCENYVLMQREDPCVIDNMVEILSSLVENKQLRCHLGRQAREDVKNKYNLENWNNGLKRAFDRALGVRAKA